MTPRPSSAKAYSYRYRVVTLDGQVVNAGGSLTGGSVNKNASILSRRGEIDALTAEAKKYAKQAEELEAQLTELRRETDTIQATVDGIEAEEKTARRISFPPRRWWTAWPPMWRKPSA